MRANQTLLELELEKSDSPPIVLPVMYNAMVPEITPAPDIKLRACFIDFPYYHEVIVTSNDIRSYFTLEDLPVSNLLLTVFKKRRRFSIRLYFFFYVCYHMSSVFIVRFEKTLFAFNRVKCPCGSIEIWLKLDHQCGKITLISEFGDFFFGCFFL